MQSFKIILNEKSSIKKMNNKCLFQKLLLVEKKWKLPIAIVTLAMKKYKIIKKKRIQQNNNNFKKIIFCFLR